MGIAPLNAAWAASPADVYLAGYHAALHSADGSAFSSIGVEGSFFAVWGASAGDVYFAGELAVIAHGRR